jgi:hypothetical protein
MPPRNEPQTDPEAFKIEQIGGMIPAWDDHLIPAGQAASCLNAYLFSGAMQGWRTPKLLHTFENPNTTYAYRIPNQTESIATALLFIVDLPLDGDQVTLGEEVYTFTATVTDTSAAYSVLIGSTPMEAAINLFAAFTFDNGAGTNAGTLYGVGTVANPAIDQTSPVTANVLAAGPPRIQVFAPSAGAAFNETLVGENTGATRLNWQNPVTGATVTSFVNGQNVTLDTGITAPSTWLEFLDPDTDVMRSPVVDDQFGRYYFASPSLPPQYNTLARILAGEPPFLLGVPAPGCTPGVSVSGGGNTAQIGFPTSTSVNVGVPGANIIYLIPVTPQGAEVLNDVALIPQTSSATAQIAALLYEDENGSPGNLLNVGVSVTGTTAGVQVASAFVNPTGLLQNVQYWIGFMTDTPIAVQLADDTGSSGVVSLNTYSNGPPEILNNLQTGFPDLQVFGDCTASSVLEARAYVYTYVSAFGEESAPSPPTVVTGWSNGTWTIDLFQPPPDQLGTTRDLQTINIYRSLTGTGGASTFFFVATVPITQAQFIDNIPDSTVADNLELTSQLYTPPPEDLQGIQMMANGMAVGFRANEIWFCQPFLPHAWPPSFVLTTEYPIIGLGVSGSSVVACTTGAPYIATGVSPGTMSALFTQRSEPCVARGSILGTSAGVYYASPNGLILVNVSSGQIQNITETWITREKWASLTPLKNIRAVPFVSTYFALGCTRNGDNSVAQQGYTVELSANDADSFTIWPQAGGHRLGFGQLTSPNDMDVLNLRVDPWSAVVLVFYQGAVYQFDFTDPAPVMQTYTWLSKLYQQKSKKNFQAMRVWFQTPPGTPAQSATRNTAPTDDPSWDALVPGQYGIIKVFSSGNLVAAREIRKINEILRIEDGFKGETWQFQIMARVPISNIQVGTSIKALAKI